MKFAMRFLVALCAACASAADFTATFDEGTIAPFVLSTNDRYSAQKVTAKDGSLRLELANRMYGMAAPVDFASAGDLIIQYEVTLTEGLACGGAYVKLLEAPVDATNFDDESPFVIMFGPDRCGATDKVHMILRYENPVSKAWTEHHLKEPPKVQNDKHAHLYSLSVRHDDSFTLSVDGGILVEGSLFDSLTPPLTPARQIDDPTDAKPDDWVDAAKVDDPKARKPFDWDEDAPRKVEDEAAEMPAAWLEDAPRTVPDPDARMPDDWDVEEDGGWEAPEVPNPLCAAAAGCGPWSPPVIDNPAFKGKWLPPKVDNPDYKGKWAPKKVDNAEYFEPVDPAKSLRKIGAVAVEVWTTVGGIEYDAFYLGADAAAAAAAAEPFHVKKAAEAAAEAVRAMDKAARKLAKAKGLKGLAKQAEGILVEVADQAKAAPLPAAATLLAVLVSLSVLCGKKKKAAKNDDSDDDDDESDEEESDDDEDAKKAAAKKTRSKTPKAE